MLHPFAEDTKDLTISELTDKISDLSQKYFRTSNPQVQNQIQTFIDYYKQEIAIKTEQERKEQQNQQNGNLDLDNLIKVS
tara:strand:- start:1640 stop:1879 length:240 start_codon:yes stop_codon:yes gene_type:complete